jgi:hypothetical protein
MNGGSKRMTSKGWRATLVSILVDQTHSAKLTRQVDLSPGGDDGLVPHQKNIGTTYSPSESSSAAAVSETR